MPNACDITRPSHRAVANWQGVFGGDHESWQRFAWWRNAKIFGVRLYTSPARAPGGFRLPIGPTERIWRTHSGKAESLCFPDLLDDPTTRSGSRSFPSI